MKTLKESKLKEILFNNIGLKILAVLIAMVLWIIVVNIDDPSQRKTISGISVTLLNENDLTSKGYTYEVEEGGSISIVVRGPQSIIEDLKATDFYAYADLSERTPQSNKSKITVNCTKEDIINQIDIVSQQTEYVKLSIDNKIEKNFDVNVDITGTPAKGYVVSDYSVSPTTIHVAGAQSTVDKIASVKIKYNVEGLTTDTSDTATPVFYDADGNVIKSDRLELNRDSVKVYVNILPTKEIKVNYTASGTPADGYKLDGIEGDLTKVTIVGSKNKLASIDAIDIPAGVIDVTGLSADKTFKIPLSTYLPEDYKIVSAPKELTVKASIQKLTQKTFQIKLDDIDINNLGSDYNLTYIQEAGISRLDVVVTGTAAELSKLTAADLGASIDMKDKVAGSSKVKVSFTDSKLFSIESNYYVWVKIDSKNGTSTQETTSASTETTTQGNNNN